MEFIEKINQLKERAIALKDSLQTEEATKNALIMPFLNALGYDVFNPLEVVPEYVADSRLKKDEKVDYAIIKDGKPVILVECKKVANDKLDVKTHAGQLFKYFTASKAKFIILTNGIVYKFFSDIEETNILDKEPFFVFNILEFKDNQIENLAEFKKDSFDVEKVFSNAGDLKFIRMFADVLESEYRTPSDDFVKYLFYKSDVEGRKTANIIEKHKKTAKEAFNMFMSKVMKTSLNLSLDEKTEEKAEKEVVTTLEELEGYAIVKSMLYGIIDASRVTYRDNRSYCNVLLDNNINKTVCRLYFNTAQKYIAFLVDKKEVKTPINGLNDIFKFKEQIINKVTEIEKAYSKK
jgi:hypothetical protein